MRPIPFYCFLLVIFAHFHSVSAQQTDTLSQDADAGFDTLQTPDLIFKYSSLHHDPFLINRFQKAYNSEIVATGGYRSMSNSIPVAVSNAFLIGPGLSGELKEKAFNRLKSNNLFDGELSVGLTYFNHKFAEGERKFSWFAGAGITNRFMLLLPQDAAQIVLAGNAQFENREAILSGSFFQQLQYNSIYGGILWHRNATLANVSWGFGLSFLQGAAHTLLEVEQGELFTAEDGEYLDLNYRFNAFTGHEGAPNQWKFNGVGGAASFHISIQQPNNYQLRLHVSEVGFINWNNVPKEYYKDTVTHFVGYDIPNIFKADSLDSEKIADTLINEFAPLVSADAYTSFVPALIELSFTKLLLQDKTLMLTPGIVYRSIPLYVPTVYVKTGYYFSDKFVPSISISVGGYSGFNVGAEVAGRIDRYSYSIGSNAVQGLIFPGATSSALYIKAGVAF